MSLPRYVLLVCLLVAAVPVPVAAQDGTVAVSGRHPATVTRTAGGEGSWSVGFVGGGAAGGDLLQAVLDHTASWQAPAGGSFQAERLTVTLDEDLLLGVILSRRITALGSLRLSGSWSEMDATALANDSQFVHPVLFDRLTMIRLGLFWEQRLLSTRLAPYLLVGGVYLDVDAASPALRQSVLAPCWGAGLTHRLDRFWSLRLEIADTIRQLHADGLAEEDGIPPGVEVRELGPQHLLEIVAGVTLTL